MRVRERKAQIRKRAAIGGGWNEQIGILPISREVTRTMIGAADSGDAVIVSVPPYHIAAVANLLSNLYSGRRIVYLDRFTARGWKLDSATAR